MIYESQVRELDGNGIVQFNGKEGNKDNNGHHYGWENNNHNNHNNHHNHHNNHNHGNKLPVGNGEVLLIGMLFTYVVVRIVFLKLSKKTILSSWHRIRITRNISFKVNK